MQYCIASNKGEIYGSNVCQSLEEIEQIVIRNQIHGPNKIYCITPVNDVKPSEAKLKQQAIEIIGALHEIVGEYTYVGLPIHNDAFLNNAEIALIEILSKQ